MQGSGLFSFLKKGFNWLKNNKVLSTIGTALTPIIPELAPAVGVAKAVGMGRRRRIHGGALRLAGYHRGGALLPAGGAMALAGMGRKGKRIHLLM